MAIIPQQQRWVERFQRCEPASNRRAPQDSDVLRDAVQVIINCRPHTHPGSLSKINCVVRIVLQRVLEPPPFLKSQRGLVCAILVHCIKLLQQIVVFPLGLCRGILQAQEYIMVNTFSNTLPPRGPSQFLLAFIFSCNKILCMIVRAIAKEDVVDEECARRHVEPVEAAHL